jgi:hypothetical protein
MFCDPTFKHGESSRLVAHLFLAPIVAARLWTRKPEGSQARLDLINSEKPIAVSVERVKRLAQAGLSRFHEGPEPVYTATQEHQNCFGHAQEHLVSV